MRTPRPDWERVRGLLRSTNTPMLPDRALAAHLAGHRQDVGRAEGRM